VPVFGSCTEIVTVVVAAAGLLLPAVALPASVQEVSEFRSSETRGWETLLKVVVENLLGWFVVDRREREKKRKR
jgi:hypothetical protein